MLDEMLAREFEEHSFWFRNVLETPRYWQRQTGFLAWTSFGRNTGQEPMNVSASSFCFRRRPSRKRS